MGTGGACTSMQAAMLANSSGKEDIVRKERKEKKERNTERTRRATTTVPSAGGFFNFFPETHQG
jgi:glutamate 5-kinase